MRYMPRDFTAKQMFKICKNRTHLFTLETQLNSETIVLTKNNIFLKVDYSTLE